MKKLNRKIKKIVLILLGLFIMNYGIVKAVEEIQLIVTPDTNENRIKLEWNDHSTNYGRYKIWGKRKEEKEFQSLSTMDFTNTKEKIRVLNIYPGDGEMIHFYDYLGNSYTLPKSASLKKWMEEPNNENEKGYGKGYIEVIPYTIQEFNQNPSGILKDEKNQYQYDIIMFGTWDNNGNKNLSEIAAQETRKFIETGRGVLFGHDTINWDLGSSTGFIELAKKVNLTYDNQVPYFDGQNTPGNFAPVGISKIQVTKAGITNFPWDIGEVGTNLNVPKTHTVSQIPHGDIWMQFYHTKADLDQAGNFYLTTWNNTGMIQTGHSNCTATVDEQKVLANTLFYLKQITDKNFIFHHFGNDIAKPEKVELKKVEYKKNGSIVEFHYEEPKDRGSTYSYYVENVVNRETSSIQDTTITTGVKGYCYVVNNFSQTDPGSQINKTNLDPIILENIDWKKSNYLHIKAIDGAGNISETTHFKIEDKEKPILELKEDIENLTIKWKISDEKSGVDFIQLPDGTFSNQLEGEYKIQKSGIQNFKAWDKAENYVEQKIEIDIPAKVVITYINSETNLIIKEEIIEGKLGDDYSIISSIDTNIYELIKEPEITNGTMNQTIIKAVYQYKIKDAKIEVIYRDQETGEVIEKIEIMGKIGDYYQTESKLDENQYELLEVIGEENGTMKTDLSKVEYRYKRRKAQVEVQYIDEKKQIIQTEKIEGFVGEEYQVPIRDIPYYHKLDKRTKLNGTIKKEGNQVICEYKKYNMDIGIKSWISNIYVDKSRRGGNSEETREKLIKVERQSKENKKEEIKLDYQIRIQNLGEIGAKIGEIRDEIPNGFWFIEDENEEYWAQENGQVYTDILKEKELLPGESYDLKLRLTANENVTGKLTNVVRINEITNEANFEETDMKNNEDKVDMIIGISTGRSKIIFWSLPILIISMIGIVIYQKYRKNK